MRIGAAVDKGEAPRNLLEIVRFPHVEDQCITAAAHHGRLHDQPARLVSAEGGVWGFGLGWRWFLWERAGLRRGALGRRCPPAGRGLVG